MKMAHHVEMEVIENYVRTKSYYPYGYAGLLSYMIQTEISMKFTEVYSHDICLLFIKIIRILYVLLFPFHIQYFIS